MVVVDEGGRNSESSPEAPSGDREDEDEEVSIPFRGRRNGSFATGLIEIDTEMGKKVGPQV